MLRWAFLLLLVANAVYFAGTQGHLAAFGWLPDDPREPERLQRQIEPERLRLLNGPQGSEPVRVPPASEPAAAAPAPVAAPAPAPAPATPVAADAGTAAPATNPPPLDEGPRACWQAGGFTEAQVELLRAELRLLGLAEGEATFTESRNPGRWIVYMGRYDNAEQAARKKAELRALGIEFRDVSTNGLAPGLALGTFSSEDAARQALQQTERRGVRTARVVQERAESTTYTLRLPAITDARRRAVDGLGVAMAGRTLGTCN